MIPSKLRDGWKGREEKGREAAPSLRPVSNDIALIRD